MMNLNRNNFLCVNCGIFLPFLSDEYESAMKKFLLGFAEGYFIVSVNIYIVTYLILKKPINTLFYLETYPILLGLSYVGYKYKTKESKIGN